MSGLGRTCGARRWMALAAMAGLLIGPATALARPGLVPLGPASAWSHDEQALVGALRRASLCRVIQLWLGPVARCTADDPPEQYRELYRHVLALTSGDDDPAADDGAGDWTLSRQLWCQLSLGYAAAEELEKALRGRLSEPGGRSARPHRARSVDAFRSVPRRCDVEVRKSRTGLTLPRVGAQCRAAIGEPGSTVDADALARCVRRLITTWVARAHPRPDDRRPNIVVILTDDQRADTIDRTHSPDDTPIMPAVMDRLAGEGVVFANAYVTNPVCAPSRATAMTGRYTSGHELRQNGLLFDDDSTIATWLHDAGYRTGFIGKYLNEYPRGRGGSGEPPLVPAGWDVWQAFSGAGSPGHFFFDMIENGVTVHYGSDLSVYSTDVLADQALDFIEDSAVSEAPFFLFISTSAPHYPWLPALRHWDQLAASPPFLPANYFEEDVSDKPAWVQDLDPYTWLRSEGLQVRRRRQLEMLLSVDDLVAGVLDALDAQGIGDDTVILYTSDNGEAWGEHRWYSKACPWEECLGVPLIVRAPGLAPLPRIESRLAVNIDLAPTIAELARVPVPDFVDGVSLVTALDDTADVWRSEFLVESFSGEVRSYSGVHTGDAILVEYLDREFEFYDLTSDPFQLENRAHDPTAAPMVLDLLLREAALRAEHGY